MQKTVKTANPNTTCGGRTRIKGFQKEYLETLLEETSKPKEKARIKKRIAQLDSKNAKS